MQRVHKVRKLLHRMSRCRERLLRSEIESMSGIAPVIDPHRLLHIAEHSVFIRNPALLSLRRLKELINRHQFQRVDAQLPEIWDFFPDALEGTFRLYL